MAPNAQKIVTPKRPGAKHGRLPKSQAAPQSVPLAGSSPGPKRIKLTFTRGQFGQPDERDADFYQFPLSAPTTDNATVQDDVHNITSSATITKLENDEGDFVVNSSPPQVFSLRAEKRIDSPMTIQGHDCPPRRNPVSEDVYDILSTLRSSAEIQADLPNLETGGVSKPYTAAFLTSLYIQCYENSLWHICDLVADTWIRALQDANARTQKSGDKRCHMWRKNVALEAKFKEGKLGFKKETEDLGLDVEDPDLAPDAATFIPEHIRDLYAHTRPECGARLLWADAMALAGRKMESEITRHPDVWPRDLLHDVMCPALRLVGRKLTLKIEEKYEGAWCKRYHEHDKHGLPCYRQLAAKQNGTEDDDARSTRKGRKRERSFQGRGEQDAKSVRFGASAGAGAQQVMNLGDVDAEGESEEG